MIHDVTATAGMTVTAAPKPDGVLAVLFDVDGTLLDTCDYIFGAFDAALTALGQGRCDPLVYREVVGQPLAVCYRRLAPLVDAEALAELHRAWQADHLELVRPMPGASTVLGELRRRSLRVAAVTTRSRRSSIASLERAGLLPLIEVVVSAEDVTRHKPDPEPVHLALARLGVKPDAAVMVGDTPADVGAGRAAGVRTIGVTFGFAGPAIGDARPDVVIEALDELTAWLDTRRA
jgi:pyrophosphatase PpaX